MLICHLLHDGRYYVLSVWDFFDLGWSFCTIVSLLYFVSLLPLRFSHLTGVCYIWWCHMLTFSLLIIFRSIHGESIGICWPYFVALALLTDISGCCRQVETGWYGCIVVNWWKRRGDIRLPCFDIRHETRDAVSWTVDLLVPVAR